MKEQKRGILKDKKDSVIITTLEENFKDESLRFHAWFCMKSVMALALNDIINENVVLDEVQSLQNDAGNFKRIDLALNANSKNIALEDIAKKYFITKGRLQSLLNEAGNFAKMAASFCSKLYQKGQKSQKRKRECDDETSLIDVPPQVTKKFAPGMYFIMMCLYVCKGSLSLTHSYSLTMST